MASKHTLEVQNYVEDEVQQISPMAVSGSAKQNHWAYFAHWFFFSGQNENSVGHLTPPQLTGQQVHILLSREMCGILETIPEYI